MPAFSGVLSGVGDYLFKPSTPVKPTAGAQVTTPVDTISSIDRGSPLGKSSVKSAKSEARSSPAYSGMARPVGVVSRTPSAHVSVKSEPSSRSLNAYSGMASIVRSQGASAALQRSGSTYHVSSPVPASSGSVQQSPQTIASSGGTPKSKPSSGKLYGQAGRPYNFP